jgi:hypothetical protein
MGYCRNIMRINGKLIGDTLEISMMEDSPFNLDSNDFSIESIFEFESSLQTMSVIVSSKEILNRNP